jgi:omega-amidase
MPIKVTTIQYDIAWENINANKQKIEELLASQLKTETDIIVLPEMFTTGFSMVPHNLAETVDGPTMQWLNNKSKQYNAVICGSLILKNNNNYFNSFFAIEPNGALHTYNKKHLFTKAGEQEHYSPGTNNICFNVKGFTVRPLICYDIRFPVWCRNTLQANGQPLYDVLLVVANWPETRIWHWESLLVARAIENQCYVVACNRVGIDANENEYNGYSLAIEPNGHIIYKIVNKELVYTTTLHEEVLQEVRVNLPFLKDADNFTIG